MNADQCKIIRISFPSDPRSSALIRGSLLFLFLLFGRQPPLFEIVERGFHHLFGQFVQPVAGARFEILANLFCGASVPR